MKDWIPIFVAFIMVVPPTILSYLTLRRSGKNSSAIQQNTSAIKDVHQDVNGKMDKLLDTTRVAAHLQGKEEGREEEKARTTEEK